MENKKQICRLCLNIITDDNFKVIEESLMEILSVVSLKLNLEKNGDIICSTCSIKLFAAFDFKSTCLYVEDKIVPFVKTDQTSSVDLREVYFKEQENEHKDKIFEDHKVCRLCMQMGNDGFVPLCEVKLDMVFKYIPEINFSITKDPVVCKSCFDALLVHIAFIKKCSDEEEKCKSIYDGKVTDSQPFIQPFELVKIEDTEIKQEICEVEGDGSIKAEGVQMDSGINEQGDKELLIKTEDIEIKAEDNRQGSCGILPLDASCGANGRPSQIKGFKCYICDYKSINKRDVEAHMIIHRDRTSPDAYKCLHCDYRTKYLRGLKKHMLTHKDVAEIKWYNCNLCSYKSKKKYLGSHMLIHKDASEIRWYRCRLCNYKSKRKGNLTQHILTHKNPSEIEWYECDLCNYKTRHKNNLKQHMLTHTNPSEIHWYKCDLCSYKSKYKSDLKGHMLIHKSPSEIEWYECDLCDYKSKYKKYLKQHKLKHKNPSEIEWYECDFCNYKSELKDRLRSHMLIHKDSSEIQWHECHLCDFKSKYRCDLKRHVGTHEDPLEVQQQKRHLCACKSEEIQERHMLIQKNDMQVHWYECYSCDYKSKRRSNFRRHVLIHQGSLEIK